VYLAVSTVSKLYPVDPAALTHGAAYIFYKQRLELPWVSRRSAIDRL
jgi:hypothetical protein